MDAVSLAWSSQAALTLYFVATHWIPMGSFNDLRFERRWLNASFALVMLALCIGTYLRSVTIVTLAAALYSVWMTGHLLSWWIPYFTGWPAEAAASTHQGIKILPVRHGRPTPDLLHTILGFISALVLATTCNACQSLWSTGS